MNARGATWGMLVAIIAVGMMTGGCRPPKRGQEVQKGRNVSVRARGPFATETQRAIVGAGSCTSSGCHAAPVDGHAAWQSAYTVWSTRDPHSRAHEALRGPLAERIVAALVARDPACRQPPAHENLACIGCHATAPGPMLGEGVSCESCHGPAGRWLVAHTAKGWKTRGNDLGMTDLADPFVGASTCSTCHVGGPPRADGAIREVTHDLIAAGHPRLAFELRSYKRAEPPHWRIRFPVTAEDGGLGPVDEWAFGRLGVLANFLQQVESQSLAATTGDRGLTSGVWPEFTSFDCYGCHRPAWLAASMRPAGVGLTAPPGSPRLEPMYWAHLDAFLPRESSEPLSQVRLAVDRQWMAKPDAALLAAARRGIDGIRPRLHDYLAAFSAGDLADRIARGTNAASWAEAVSALGALEALADREAAAGRLSNAVDVRAQLALLHKLLEFPIELAAGKTERFSSPRGYDAKAVAKCLQGLAAALDNRH